ncbi:RseA-like anti sigma(E) protein [Cricetibacter osteomyelitidis]|uniref:Anti-sigma-E factor RseA n=1 Tax=Cricetibacter osteomyelitidis TaxID=1521931 RepID=A0A4R2SLK3_9PAST|nr:sigma-E factor negative regulatory protein [Cricetibacter osteomyelitidis]TCP88804.1 RseA-like anti sigma(E) protein [Cricetibacter osteomyelitidis]
MQKELLSAYMDGENVDQQTVDMICQDVGLQQKWANYHTVRSVMRQESEVFLGAGFTAKMAELIDAEPTLNVAKVFEDQPSVTETVRNLFAQRIKALLMPLTQFAVAAGVCFAVVFGVQTSMNKDNSVNNDIPVLQTSPFNSSTQAVSYNAPAQDVATSEKVEEHNKRIGSMLQNYELQRRIYADDLQLNSSK